MNAPARLEQRAAPAAPATLTRREFIGTVALAAASAPLARGAAAPAWQIGCYTRPWPVTDYRTALDGIAAAGFKFAGLMTTKNGVVVQPATPPEQVVTMAAEAKARRLSIASIYGGDFMRKRTVDDGIANLRRLVDHAVRCRCPSLLLGGTGDPKLVDDYYKVVAECCEYAATRGVGLTVKPHGGLNSTGPQCRQLIQKVGHRNFRLWYDAGNIFYYSEGRLNPVDDAATVDGLVVGMSIKDFLPPKDVNVTPGTGRVNFAAVLARLQRGGFTQGPLMVECVAGTEVATVTAEAQKARRFVEQLIGEQRRG